MSTDATLNQSEQNVILAAHATKVNRTEPNWTEPQTCLACQNHALNKENNTVQNLRTTLCHVFFNHYFVSCGVDVSV